MMSLITYPIKAEQNDYRRSQPFGILNTFVMYLRAAVQKSAFGIRNSEIFVFFFKQKIWV